MDRDIKITIRLRVAGNTLRPRDFRNKRKTGSAITSLNLFKKSPFMSLGRVD